MKEMMSFVAWAGRNTMSASIEPVSAATAVVRYSVYVPVPSLPEEDCDDLALQFVVNGPVVPRVGERLEFDGARGNNLSLVVSEVSHTFGIKSPGATDRAKVFVTADIDDSPLSIAGARKLLEPAALYQWVSEFEMLEFPEHLRRCL
ncbi:hypothetical protein AB0I30_08305 [Nocardia tengchongensis]|uniref:hypothetical protein n=1 Tax=Nocardia tengchongensis TaxID=2055889 RepID=UPI0033E8D97D